jgi:hypothetical protein
MDVMYVGFEPLIDLKDNSVLLEKWVEEYGNVVKIKGFLGVR